MNTARKKRNWMAFAYVVPLVCGLGAFASRVDAQNAAAPADLANLPSNYEPLYFASAVLSDGRLLIEGGEYNFGNFTLTNLGAIYDPKLNIWTAVNPPTGWDYMGECPSVVLQ